MPSKSRHRRDKHLTRSKKGENRQDFSVSGAQQPATARNSEPLSPATTPSIKIRMPGPKLTPLQHPYIAIELRRIAILAGIMLVVLVVLSLVIP